MPSRSAKKVSSCGKAEAVDGMNFETRMKLNQRDLPSMSIQFQWLKKMENRWYCCILRKKSRNNIGLTYCHFSKYQALFLLICHVKWIAIAGQIYPLSLLHFSFFDLNSIRKFVQAVVRSLFSHLSSPIFRSVTIFIQLECIKYLGRS